MNLKSNLFCKLGALRLRELRLLVASFALALTLNNGGALAFDPATAAQPLAAAIAPETGAANRVGYEPTAEGLCAAAAKALEQQFQATPPGRSRSGMVKPRGATGTGTWVAEDRGKKRSVAACVLQRLSEWMANDRRTFGNQDAASLRARGRPCLVELRV